MDRFSKYLYPQESVRRTGGMSTVALAADAVWLVLLVLAYWLITRVLLAVNSDQPLSVAMAPFMRTMFNLLTLFLAVVALLALIRLTARALTYHYAITSSRVLVGTFFGVRSVELAHVQDAEVVHTPLGKLLGYGDIVVTPSGASPIVLKKIAGPFDWYRDLHELILRARNPVSPADELGKLAELRAAGALSDDDWARAKDLFLGQRPDAQANAVEHLKQLHALWRSGVLSESEFNIKKWEVLSRNM